jgi:hypothetical protein
MTETEWWECGDPNPMLEFLRLKASDRKVRLFTAACCRHLGSKLTDERSWRAIDVVERYADGLANEQDLESAFHIADAASQESPSDAADAVVSATTSYGPYGDQQAIRIAYATDVARVAVRAAPTPLRPAVRAAQAALLRDLFGHLQYRPVQIAPTWITWHEGTIPTLTHSIYTERRFHDLPLVAKALEEAGCTDTDILSHCREPGPHVRGCWVVDLILSKDR